MAEDKKIRLTQTASCCGCGAKIGPGELAQLLEGIPTRTDPRLLVGYDKSDDASVYRINDELALVQTVDFFPPIVDDPYMFGQIAAANALSDVYAMGGVPKLAMNVMCFHSKLGKDTVRGILEGGYAKAYEAGVIITGGHTIEDKEPKYGLAVTGFVHPQKLLRNSSARAGDVLLLTKPLGVGILMSAAKGDLVAPALLEKLYAQMAQLNRAARDILIQYDVHSCTDVTGFGLLGHAYEMAHGSGVSIHIRASAVPYHTEAVEMASMGFVPAGAYRNADHVGSHLQAAPDISRAMMDILCDPQTSGGLLIAVAEKDAQALQQELSDALPCAAAIGYAAPYEGKSIFVES